MNNPINKLKFPYRIIGIALFQIFLISLFIFSGNGTLETVNADSISVSTDKEQYVGGETLVITGYLDKTPNSGETIYIQIYDSNDNIAHQDLTITTDGSGNYQHQWILPSSPTGTWNVTVVHPVSGGDNLVNSKTFSLLPATSEFSGTAISLFLIILPLPIIKRRILS